jgi:hypothetical protein
VLPAIAEPDFVIELDTMTAMYGEMLAGGPELLPGSLTQALPQPGKLVVADSAKPLKLAGAGPLLSEFYFAH